MTKTEIEWQAHNKFIRSARAEMQLERSIDLADKVTHLLDELRGDDTITIKAAYKDVETALKEYRGGARHDNVAV